MKFFKNFLKKRYNDNAILVKFNTKKRLTQKEVDGICKIVKETDDISDAAIRISTYTKSTVPVSIIKTKQEIIINM